MSDTLGAWRRVATTLAIATVVTATLVLGARRANAQSRPAAAPSTPPTAPLLPDGVYEFTLTPASVQQRVLASAPPITVDAQVTHDATEATIITVDGMTLRGGSSATHLKASGAVQRSTLTLELGGSGTSASGTFLLAAPGAQRLTGTATVVPASREQTRAASRGSCSGFWTCVKAIRGYDWSVFGD